MCVTTDHCHACLGPWESPKIQKFRLKLGLWANSTLLGTEQELHVAVCIRFATQLIEDGGNLLLQKTRTKLPLWTCTRPEIFLTGRCHDASCNWEMNFALVTKLQSGQFTRHSSHLLVGAVKCPLPLWAAPTLGGGAGPVRLRRPPAARGLLAAPGAAPCRTSKLRRRDALYSSLRPSRYMRLVSMNLKCGLGGEGVSVYRSAG